MLGLILGVALFAGVNYFQSKGVSVSLNPNHDKIAGLYSVQDTLTNEHLKAFILNSHIITQTANVANFTKGSAFQESVYAWGAENGDVYATMSITGPDASGKVYNVEFGRLCLHPLTISGPGLNDNWALNSNLGYAKTEYIMP